MHKLGLFKYGAIFLTLLATGFFIYLLNPEIEKTSFVKKEKIYETISPKISESFSTQKFIGKVYSNKFAMIHPRREGIIKDILVDIGDVVKVGQTIAYLFPPGVEGEGETQIAQAKAQLLSAQEELQNAKMVAGDSVGVAEKKLFQTQTDLENIVGGNPDTRSQMVQNQDQAEVMGLQVIRNLDWILFGDTKASRTVNSLIGDFKNKKQESIVFKNFQAVGLSKKAYEGAHREEKPSLLYKLLDQTESLLIQVEILYQGASINRRQSADQIEKNTKSIQDLRTQVLGAKELIDKIFLTVDTLSGGVETAQETLSLTSSQAQESIDAASNKLEIARAAYRNVLVKNGHVQITSPFSGEISTKFIEVGHIAQPGTALFEIMEVDTSLAEKAPIEIKVGIPEAFIHSINVGEKVTVHLPLKLGMSLPAIVSRKSAQIDTLSNTAMISVTLEDMPESLSHNSNVYVLIQDQGNPIYEIPSSSIKKQRNKNFIFLKNTEGYEKREIQILAEDGEYSDVKGDIDLEMHIIKNPSVNLFQQVKND